MKDETRQPTKLDRLAELTNRQSDRADDYDEDNIEHDMAEWLMWTYNFLSARKLYHKKARIRTAMLEKMAKTLLSPDELQAIDNEAEKQLGNLGEVQHEVEEVE